MTSTSTFSLSQTTILVFTGEKYDFWSIHMRAIFISQGLWDVVTYGPVVTTTSKDTEVVKDKELVEEEKQKDARAICVIFQGVSESVFPRIMGAQTAKQAWDTLKEDYKGDEKVITLKLQNMWREFENLSMKAGKKVEDLLTRTLHIINQIRNFGDTIEDRKIVPKLLRSLPPSFYPVVTAIVEKMLS